MCSFGNPAIGKEHWLQIYPPILPLWPIGHKAQDYCDGSLPILINLPISMTKHHFGAILY